LKELELELELDRTINAAAAVFDIHMERNAVTSMNAIRIIFFLFPTNFNNNRAIRLCNKYFSTAYAI
jgi:hypothetical protein